MQNRLALEADVAANPAVPAERPPCDPAPARVDVVARPPEPIAIPFDSAAHAPAEALRRWRDLARRAPPMLAPEFMLLSARLAGARDLLLVGATRGDALASALLLARRGRTLQALRTDHTPRVDFVGDAASLPILWEAVRRAGGWDVLELRGVPADSPLAVDLPRIARGDRCAAYVRETSRAPWFETADIEQRIHRRFRGDMRRLERQLGGVELERFARFDHDALRDVLRLEAAAWKGAAGTAIACEPRLVRFYAALARLFARRGRLTLAFLRARGKRIAAQFALEDDSTYYLLKTGYDPDYTHFGPGQLLVRETAADAARRGLARYDLLGKDSAWKAKWTERFRAHVEIVVYAASTRGRVRRLAREVARPAAGRVLRAVRPKAVAGT